MNYQYNRSYTNHSFWENKLTSNCDIWSGNFNDEPITKDSVIIYSGFMNQEKDIFEHGWVVYPNIYTALGFIQKVFIPTATVTWYKSDTTDFLVPIVDLNIIMDDLLKDNHLSHSVFDNIQNLDSKLTNLWETSTNDFENNLTEVINDFNTLWDEIDNKKIFIKVFFNIDNILPFVQEVIGWDDLLEEETSMSLDHLNNITEEVVLSNPLFNKTLIELLNNNMPILF